MLKRAIVMLMVSLPLVSCDQVTKYQATQHLMGEAPRSFFNDILRLEYAVNPGAWGGMLGNAPDFLRLGVLAYGVGLFLLALAGYIIFQKHSTQKTVALSLLLAGGIGNVIDRALNGQVVDFLNVGIGSLRTNIFNVADMVALLGVGLMLYYQFTQPEDEADAPVAA